MSRVGKIPVTIPSGVTATVNGSVLKVKGKGGELSREFHPTMKVVVDGDVINVTRAGDSKRQRELHGTTRALVQNMVQGVAQGFSKTLEIVGVGWNAKMKGKQLSLQIGFCHTIEFNVPAGLKLELPNPQQMTISGTDKQVVGQFAAQVRAIRPPEPYKGKGIKYVGEYIIRKVGKSQVGK